MELQAFVLDSILIVIGMFCWNAYLAKRLDYNRQINRGYNHIFNQNYQHLFVIKPNGCLLEVNQQAVNDYDFNPKNIRGKPLWLVFPQITVSTQRKLQDAIAKAAQGEPVSLNIERLQEEITLNKIKFSFTPIADRKGKIKVIVAEICNIDQSIQTEITQKQQLLETFFNKASIGLAILDDKWRHVQINDVLADINGKSVEEHIGKTVREIVPQVAPQLESIYQQVATTVEAVCGIEINGETPKQPGVIRSWEASYFSLPVSNHRNGIGCVVLEVTERKKTQTDLANRIKQQATIAQLGQLALSGLELPALFKQTTVLVAQSLNVDSCKILELVPNSDALVLRSSVGLESDLLDNITVETNYKSQAGYTLLSGQTVILDNLNEENRFTGSSLLHQHQYISGVSTIIPGEDNQPFGVLEAHSTEEHQFSWDDANFLQSIANILSAAITRKQAEAENRQLNATLEARVKQRTEQLEEVNQELEAFCYSVSHDLRAPLRAIQGFAQVLLEDYESLFDEMGREYLNRLITAAGHLDTLILDLLAYSRLGRTQIQLGQVDLASVVEGILRELESELQEKQAQVIIKTTLPVVKSQQSILKSIITNLITNAIKFVHPKARAVVQIWAEERGKYIRLWVEDNGIGIAPEHQERIFRVFERLHGVESYVGTGIGLAIVKRGVESIDGSVGVFSNLNHGSLFWIELPKCKE
ncbi:two-component hybrid sensor and regulator [Calothrix parasitica NIES-267]|uniref:histidine kinase n=1 Tax=Calothrix parasitica NIES-267 TaxID=1973488 RepID=A0A1Z4LNJ4_9CYAN|nr:two-component hybrid sensor and regulator [Calothrix parasitica NIES-267]